MVLGWKHADARWVCEQIQSKGVFTTSATISAYFDIGMTTPTLTFSLPLYAKSAFTYGVPYYYFNSQISINPREYFFIVTSEQEILWVDMREISLIWEM